MEKKRDEKVALNISGQPAVLRRRHGKTRWQLEFRSPASEQRIRISTGLRDLMAARAKAAVIINRTYREGMEGLKAMAKRKPSSGLLVGGIIDHYLATSSVTSAKHNVNSLMLVFAVVYPKKSPEKIRAMPAEAISDTLAYRYQESCSLAPSTIRSCLAKARAVFCCGRVWQRLALPPEIAKFQKAASKTGIKTNLDAFIPLPESTLAKMEASSKAIGGDIRRAYLLARRCGLGPKEIAGCRRRWMFQEDHRWQLLIVQRPDEGFTLKTGAKRQRQIGLPDDVAKELLEASDYMVSGNTPFMRHSFCIRVVNPWLRQYLPERKDLLYSLRKQAGSDLLNQTGKISVVQRFLGHSSPLTTARHYATSDLRVNIPD